MKLNFLSCLQINSRFNCVFEDLKTWNFKWNCQSMRHTVKPRCSGKERKRPMIAYCFTQCPNGCSLGSFLFPRQQIYGQRCSFRGDTFFIEFSSVGYDNPDVDGCWWLCVGLYVDLLAQSRPNVVYSTSGVATPGAYYGRTTADYDIPFPQTKKLRGQHSGPRHVHGGSVDAIPSWLLRKKQLSKYGIKKYLQPFVQTNSEGNSSSDKWHQKLKILSKYVLIIISTESQWTCISMNEWINQ